MPKSTTTKYIETIKNLHKAIQDAYTHKWWPGSVGDPDPKSTWRTILPLVAEVTRLAKIERLPPAANFQVVPREQIPTNITIPSDGEIRLQTIFLRNTVMQAIMLPIRAEKKSQGNWVPGEYCRFALDQGQPFEIDKHFWDWIMDLENPRGRNGIRDGAFTDCPWRTHIERERQKEIAQLQYSLGMEPFGAKKTHLDESYKKQAMAIMDKYRDVQITMRYLSGVVECYMHKLNTIIDMERKGIPVVSAQARNISESVRLILVDAMPLNLSDAPDFSSQTELSPREALVIMDRLRKCLMRRSQQAGGPAANIGQAIVESSDTPNPKQDGPDAPNLFRWNSRQAELGAVPWRLLNFVWNCGERKCEQDEAIGAVWATDNVTIDAIKSAVRRINEALNNAGCHLSISQKHGYFIIS